MRRPLENPSSGDLPGWGYRPEIDGLRALAVVAVVFFHAHLGVPGGYIGVDVFFVISGYLISSLILKDLEAGQFTLRGFWVRRVRRILPALVVLVLAVLAAGWFFLLPEDFLALGHAAIWQSLFGANIYAWMDTGYFVAAADQKPLLHLWSLAVEEQFYLFVPVLFLVVFRSRLPRARSALLGLATTGVALSLAFSIYTVAHHRGVAFYLLPSRAWELALGSCVALWPASAIPRSRALREGLCLTGLLAILAPCFLYSEETPFPGLAAIPPCLGTALLILGSTRLSPASPCGIPQVAALLAWRPVVLVGLISYSLYLWHWPLFAFANYWAFRPLPRVLRVALVAVAFVLATLSWIFVERPFRRNRSEGGHPLLVAAASLACVAVLGLVIVGFRGFPTRSIAAADQYRSATEKSPWIRDYTAEDVRLGNLPRLGNPDPSVPISVVVWGDSHAMASAPAFDVYLRERGLAGVLAARSSTPPIPGSYWNSKYTNEKQAVDFNAAVLEYISTRKIPSVYLVAAWTGYPDPSSGEMIADLAVKTVESLVDQGISTTLLLQVPEQNGNIPRLLALSKIFPIDPSREYAPVTGEVGLPGATPQVISKLAAMGCRILDPRPKFLDATGARYVGEMNGICLYRDGDHLSTDGSKAIWLPLLRESQPTRP